MSRVKKKKEGEKGERERGRREREKKADFGNRKELGDTDRTSGKEEGKVLKNLDCQELGRTVSKMND